MSTNISESITSKFVAWLNKHYPHLAVVMYDIGARYGIHYLYLELLNLKKFSVVGFEPDPEEVTKLVQAKNSGIKKIFPLALAESKGMRKIYITKHPGCSSLYPPNQKLLSQYLSSDFFELIDTKLIETISLDEFIEQFDVVPPDFLKIDIQGAEYEVLQGGKLTLNNVVGIFLETQLRELYLGAPLFPEIHSLLTNQGFRLIFCEYNADLGGEIVEFDVAYIRDLTKSHQEENLLKAILFCLVHKNLDFAANLVRMSHLSSSKKLKIMEILSQPLNPTKMVVNPDNPYISSKIELRKIHEDWWKTEPN